MYVTDMHCDTISELLAKKRRGEEASLRDGGCHVNLHKMKKGDYLLQNFALFVELGEAGSASGAWSRVQELFLLYEQEMEKNRDMIGRILRFSDIESNRSAGRMSAMLTVEEGGVCGGDLDKLRALYGQGVRMMTLLWNYPNELGYPNLDRERGRALRAAGQSENAAETDRLIRKYLNTPDEEHGLTKQGFAFVEEMERLGMIVDVSHMSDAGFYDVCRVAKKPFVASHSNARALCPCARNLSDDMIRRLAEHGGVTGLNFCADFLTQVKAGEKNPGTIAAVVKHARHIVNMGGIGCLGLGSDFDGIDTHAELPGADCMPLLWEALKKDGFTESELDDIFEKNVLRVYREVLS